MRLFYPVEGLVEGIPPSRRRFGLHKKAAGETPKVLATSLLGVPRSIAASTFGLRSIGQAPVRPSSHDSPALKVVG